MIEWFHEFLSRLTYAVSLENPGGLTALFGLGILSDIGVPFPYVLETFLFFASYNVGPLSIQVLLIILMLLLGRECGATFLYWLSHILGNPFIGWLGKRFPWVTERLGQSKIRLNERSILTVATVRLTPGLLQVPSVVAGIMRLRYLHFALGVAISSAIYDLVLIFLGFVARIGLQNISREFKVYFITGFIVVIVMAWFILFFTLRRSPKR